MSEKSGGAEERLGSRPGGRRELIVTLVAAVGQSLYSVAGNLLRNPFVHCASHAFREGGHRSDCMVEELLNLTRRLAR